LGEEKVHAANGKAHFFLLSMGGAGYRGGYFSGFLGSIMLTIPHHPEGPFFTFKFGGGAGFRGGYFSGFLVPLC
jgi:hypothetical protein